MKMKIELMEETESTNELAIRALESGMESGTVFVADHQTRGRGRRNTDGSRRVWHSPKGENLYLSVVLRPRVGPEKISALTLAAGVALVEAIEEVTGVSSWLKWPNDLYVGERKLAGILTEAVSGPEGIRGVVVGVGLNVNVRRRAFPSPLDEWVTSLREESGEKIDRFSLALAVAKALIAGSERYEAEGLAGFAERLGELDGLVDRLVEVRENGQVHQGRACGIGARGGLMVEWNDGRTEEVVAGEVLVHGLGGHQLRE